MIVDDEEALLSAVARLLRRCSHDVRAVSSVDEAVLQLEGMDVVLLDLHLGDGRTASENVRRITDSSPQIRVVLLSGDAAAAERMCLPFISKPFGSADLSRVLEPAA